MASLLFSPLESSVSSSFWTELARLKLDELRLSELPLDIVGASAAHALMSALLVRRRFPLATDVCWFRVPVSSKPSRACGAAARGGCQPAAGVHLVDARAAHCWLTARLRRVTAGRTPTALARSSSSTRAKPLTPWTALR